MAIGGTVWNVRIVVMIWKRGEFLQIDTINIGKKNVELTSFLDNKQCIAYLCRDCKKIVIDVE